MNTIDKTQAVRLRKCVFNLRHRVANDALQWAGLRLTEEELLEFVGMAHAVPFVGRTRGEVRTELGKVVSRFLSRKLDHAAVRLNPEPRTLNPPCP